MKTMTETSRPLATQAVLCRLGIHGQVGRLRIESGVRIASLPRGCKVLCRTARGLEWGEVLALAEFAHADAKPESQAESIGDGVLLRRLTTEDELLRQQLTLLGNEVFEDCQRWLSENGKTDVLLDVEPLMDGVSLYFHFLGSPSQELSPHLQSLAGLYQEKVQASRFANLLEHGCGPGCGTSEGGHCGPSGSACSVCVVAHACKK